MSWVKKTLGELCTIQKGKIGIKKATPGEFPLVVTAEERLSHNEYHFEGNAVVIPLVSSTGHGHKSLKRIHFQSGKFAVGNILCAVIPRDENVLRADYLFRFLFLNKEKELVSRMKGMANVTLPMKEIANVEIPVPPIEAQIEFVQQYSVLEEKSNDLGEEIEHQLEMINNLRQAFIREAMHGKLVPQDPNDEPASVLIEKIKAEKESLIKEKNAKKQKPLPSITEDEIPFKIPANWVWCRLGNSGELKRGKSKHRPRNDDRLFKDGAYPFIQTGDVARSKSNGYIINTINGYYNGFGLAQSEMQIKGTLCITIAANIAECGFLGFDACAPDSIVCYISLDKTIEKYAFYYLIDARDEIEKYAPATAQKNINLGILNSLLIPLPPLPEQQRIVAKLDELMLFCNDLEESIKESQEQNELLLQQVLRETLEPKEKEVVA